MKLTRDRPDVKRTKSATPSLAQGRHNPRALEAMATELQPIHAHPHPAQLQYRIQIEANLHQREPRDRAQPARNASIDYLSTN
jgi:hypothetical protein